jgi:hypothetical protein
MLTISSDTLPQTQLSYLAFRVAFHETLERIALANQFGDDDCDCYGFLTEVPFLRGVPAHVQLDLLAETWSRHVAREQFTASLVDESVVYAACETSARLVEEEPEYVAHLMKGGPYDVEREVDHSLACELRTLHLNLSNDGDFLLISQFEDLDPDEARERIWDVHGHIADRPQDDDPFEASHRSFLEIKRQGAAEGRYRLPRRGVRRTYRGSGRICPDSAAERRERPAQTDGRSR